MTRNERLATIGVLLAFAVLVALYARFAVSGTT